MRLFCCLTKKGNFLGSIIQTLFFSFVISFSFLISMGDGHHEEKVGTRGIWSDRMVFCCSLGPPSFVVSIERSIESKLISIFSLCFVGWGSITLQQNCLFFFTMWMSKACIEYFLHFRSTTVIHVLYRRLITKSFHCFLW